MTCYSCRWSVGSMEGLFCEETLMPAVEVCEFFEYEPGTDEDVRDEVIDDN